MYPEYLCLTWLLSGFAASTNTQKWFLSQNSDNAYFLSTDYIAAAAAAKGGSKAQQRVVCEPALKEIPLWKRSAPWRVATAQWDWTGLSFGFALIRAWGKFLAIALKRYLRMKMAIDYWNWLGLEDHIFMKVFMWIHTCIGHTPAVEVVSTSHHSHVHFPLLHGLLCPSVNMAI